MELKRNPLQGVFNIIRFNWHFYLVAGLILALLIVFRKHLPEPVKSFTLGIALLATLTIIVSLIISFYIYDISDLYQLKWLKDADHKNILNINAGFDETSEIIKSKYPDSDLTVCDFYNPFRHTEISIKRARKAYPPKDNTIRVTTDNFPFSDRSFDYALAVLSAHEIRNKRERTDFFKELNRVTKTTGQIFVTEHLRDLNNFMAYTIGFLHFHSRSSWLQTFEQANLSVKQEIRTTPFITTFVLEKNGDTF
ncbi:class I SAM-dependent methyltransferase [Sinomicrobium weinanense]|uniref:Methyltransferase domain-containing protein n=1 Tax=Sinomicrobium weinanense TaxID=2842200 RepID=A0A926JUU1_9FLAO|nr:class I SAM-dependent methyltransferase [Sinomicrobium weinanense]MBC9797776.1 methyltransferase domain-containing protein [Sinomicrobium weinanense]MBU3122405.1 class I SAM-dependent methyltransferase [Sinomicrobium weinanense]